ncbi:MAG TPA: hypothetical protein VFA06_08070 [Actinocrinis sp.]|uniref:hypothetical protein n=1 Tax=Actinocrinis sp. TaxID=1920516 RepID=UPI002D22C021|nr:hypothetical protein [Actinocrinis sp.]HZU55809.1 hypothetical protein [Actinocrinis sp.]
MQRSGAVCLTELTYLERSEQHDSAREVLIELTDMFCSQVGSVEKSLPDSLVLVGLTITGGVYRLSLLVGQVSAIEGRAGGWARQGSSRIDAEPLDLHVPIELTYSADKLNRDAVSVD